MPRALQMKYLKQSAGCFLKVNLSAWHVKFLRSMIYFRNFYSVFLPPGVISARVSERSLVVHSPGGASFLFDICLVADYGM
jgi:hypothetical protein